jgi:glutamate 5-kinase
MARYHRIVFKLGTSSLTDADHRLSRRKMVELVRQVTLLHEQGYSIVVVTSGAVAAGREAFPNRTFDATLPTRQMLASVGQVRLMHTWSEFFATYEVVVGQVLLTRADFANRSHYLNIRDTILALLSQRVIPVVNENDTVATKRLRIGDNDNLAALVANLVDADLLAFITDQEGLYTADPRKDPSAQLIPVVDKIDDAVIKVASGSGTTVGTGGMITKMQAARLAVESGTETRIVSFKTPEVLLKLAAGEPIGTRFPARATPLESRKRWLVSERPLGRIIIDAGALHHLTTKGASLLPVGVIHAEGSFERGAVVEIAGPEGKTIAVGMTNYSSDELQKVARRRSSEIAAILGYSYGDEVVHRDDLAMKG